MSRTPNWTRTWAGGRVRVADDGREVFVIERRIGAGSRRVVALDVTTEAEADAELRLFVRDPLNYRTRRQQIRERAAHASQGAALDPQTLETFLTHANALVSKGELSKNYVAHELTPYLGAWALVTAGKELRKLRLADLKAALRGWTTAHHKRIVALKAFTAWLREEGRLIRSEDPTLDLKVPAVKTRAVTERAFSKAQVEAFYKALRDYEFSPGWGPKDAPDDAPRKEVQLQAIRDVFVLRIKAGLHGTEIDRLARGDGTVRLLKEQGEIAGTLVFPHKRGGEHVVSVDRQTLASAQRLQASGKAPDRMRTARAVARVIKRHQDLAGFSFENLRHTFITLGVGGRIVTPKEGGVPLEMLAQVAGHTSVRTTRRHYLGAHVPAMIVVPVELKNVDDPKIRASKAASG